MHPAQRAEVLVDAPRYRAMEHYFGTDGIAGRTMMCNTAAVHINLDIGARERQQERWALVHAIGPPLAAAFAHSPFVNGAPSGSRSSRLANWWEIDPTRTAPVYTGCGPVQDWTRYALDARVMLIRQNDQEYTPLTEVLSFRDWMTSGHELGSPTVDDFRYHLTTLFPPVRPQGRLELRFVDALPDPWWRVPVAVISCLLDDREAAQAASAATRPVVDMWKEAAKSGLDDPQLAKAADQCFEAAFAAFDRRGVDTETALLVDAFHDRYVSRGRCPADDRLDEWAESGTVIPAASSVGLSWA
ncbi:MAG: glutamate-cysteine ligase family protein [Mycobacterium sp.]